MKKQEKGITLVALIITIIILLILAVVSIMAVTGTGLFAKASDAVDKYDNSTEKENFVMDNHIATIDSYNPGNGGGSLKLVPPDADELPVLLATMSDGMCTVAQTSDERTYVGYTNVVYNAVMLSSGGNMYINVLDAESAQTVSSLYGITNMQANTWYSSNMSSETPNFTVYGGGSPIESIEVFDGGTVNSASYLDKVLKSF